MNQGGSLILPTLVGAVLGLNALAEAFVRTNADTACCGS
jgi:hypothetical protein